MCIGLYLFMSEVKKLKKNRGIAIGVEEFDRIISRKSFYVDKTHFIKEWWEDDAGVTLITRPRRFGKTLMMSTVECFFSNQHDNSADLFQGLSIENESELMALQGTYPVINISFGSVKQPTYDKFENDMAYIISDLYRVHDYLLQSERLDDGEKAEFTKIKNRMADASEYQRGIENLSYYLHKHFGKRAIILIDEYDTPMIEAYTQGYWREAVEYFKVIFHTAFKGNKYLEKGLLTGITKVTHESLFSDLNNLKVVTPMTRKYEDCFGFTEKEVFAALDEYGLSDKKADVKLWYDGFIFGKQRDIYNPWSIICFLDEQELRPYWVNTGGTGIINHLIKSSSNDVKRDFERLLNQESILVTLDESITYEELKGDSNSIFSWLAIAGYMRMERPVESYAARMRYEMKLTNMEVREAIRTLIMRWFDGSNGDYTNFLYHLVKTGNLSEAKKAAEYVTRCVFSFYDVGNGDDINDQIERFYHGFILGILAGLNDDYMVHSNRESGFGRYDVCIEPRNNKEDGVILEFKVFEESDKTLETTAKKALTQICDKDYEAELRQRGFTKIRKYGFGFKGKEVFIVE